jgi:large subunit ribosomal protein L4
MKSARNLKNIKVINVDGLNVYDVLKFDSLIVTEESLARAQEVLKH